MAQLSASVPEAQALTGVWTPALAPSLSATRRGGAVGHEHLDGVRRDAAGAFSRSTSYWP